MAASPTRTVLRTEVRLFLREPAALFWIVLFPALLVGGLGQVPGYRDPEEGVDGVPVIALYVPVAILLAMLLAAVSTMPVALAGYREQLILKRIATTPARPRDLLIAQYAINGGAAVAGGALAMLVVRIGYGTGLPGNAAAHLLALLLALAATLAIGGLISAVVPTARLATTVGAILLFPLMFTAGVWLPVSAMPDLLGDIVSLTPLGAAALALDAAGAGGWPALRDVAVLLAWTLGTGAIAARYFRWN
ncbi:ABC transporter permease [Streptomyces calidiresistens]|uniref:Transport permease protein n=1 Tax=Streptomyces calidiresistens TaxID=1485586 RepID=A0A7W3T523_9ACTN|nr:ABC transporter permease [Streptomyces calidiresistens]MBB0231079.1 ABC transporter permease [Streptomyces calidiresistens]